MFGAAAFGMRRATIFQRIDLHSVRLSHKTDVMDSVKIAGYWKQLKGKIKEHWGRLTDDDVKAIEGQKDQLIGRLQERYGYTREQAEREANEFCGHC